MKITSSIVKGLILVSGVGLVLADSTGDCSNLHSLFPSNLKNCVVDEDGYITELELHGLTNVKENELLSLPKSLKKLTLVDTILPQYAIEELSRLVNIEELSFERTMMDKSITLEPIKNLVNLTYLYISNDNGAYTTKKYIDSSHLKNFQQIKKFEAKEYTFSQENLDTLSSLINLEELTLTECGFDEDLDFDALENLKNLESLNILGTTEHCLETVDVYGGNNCPLDEIPESIFTLTQLKKLVINRHKEIDFSTLEDLSELRNLQYLDLSGISLVTVPKSLTKLKKLTHLNLEYNFIQSLPDTFGNLKNLQELDLSENELTTLPGSFGNLKNLKKLDLKMNEFNALPEALTQIQNLEYIDLEFNNIERLSDNLGHLNNLKELNLYNNKLTVLPDSIGNLNQLERLYLGGNTITILPSSLSGLKNLQELNLYYNNLKELPDAIGDLNNLEILIVSGNNIVSLPDVIGNLTNLKVLNLNKNDLKELPISLSGLETIINIDLSYNNLTTLPETIGALKTLETLNLSNNYISSLPDSIGALESLSQLILNYNQLTTIPSALGDLMKLNVLNLAYNLIDDELPASLNDLPELYTVNFSNNIDIKGETLTNESLKECYYGASYSGILYSVCKAKELPCFTNHNPIKRCDPTATLLETETPGSEVVEPTLETTVVEDQPTETAILEDEVEAIDEPTEITILEEEVEEVDEESTETVSDCWAEALGYECCPPHLTKVYSQDHHGDWGFDFSKKEWCGILPGAIVDEEEACWSENLGYRCCEGCKVYTTDADGSWGYESHHWCGIVQSKCE